MSEDVNLIVEGLADGSVSPVDLLEAMVHLVFVSARTDAKEWGLQNDKEIRALQTRVEGRWIKFHESFMQLTAECAQRAHNE
jgi:hypothetical protein